MILNAYYLKSCFTKITLSIPKKDNEKFKTRKNQELWLNKLFSADTMGFTIAFMHVFSTKSNFVYIDDLEKILKKTEFKIPKNLKVIWDIPADYNNYFKKLDDDEINLLFNFMRDFLTQLRK